MKRAALDAKGIFDGTNNVKRDAMQIVNSSVGLYELHSDGLVSSNSLVGFNQATAACVADVVVLVEYDLLSRPLMTIR